MDNFGGRHQPENRFSAVRYGASANRKWAIDDKLLGGYFGECPVSYETAMARAEYLNGPEGKAALAAQGTGIQDLARLHPLPWRADERRGVPVMLDADNNVVVVLPENIATTVA
jgi:hypothetical protein